MQSYQYKFIDYEKDFPARLSVQNSRKKLVAPHFHEDAEILVVTKGEVLAQIGTETIHCYKGDILVLYPNTLHQVNAPDETAEITALLYQTKIIDFAGQFHPKKGGYYLFQKEHPSYPKFSTILYDAVELFRNKSSTFGIEMTACLLNLTAILVRENVMSAVQKKASESRLQPSFLYIEQNLSKAIKISDLEGVQNLSKEHIIRLFKAETGKTPAEYILDVKIKKAMEMLKNNTISITEISESLGFSNPSHLSKIFRMRLNMTPSEYKKELLRK